MDTRKIENIIIIILALLNLFLLGVVLSDRAQAKESRRETEQTVSRMLRDNGISVSSNAVLIQDTPAVYTVVRDLEREAEQMDSLLKAPSKEDLGGSILFYRSDRGQAVLRGTGETDILMTGNSVPIKGSREKTAEKFFADAQIETVPAPQPEDGESIACYCTWNGIPVYNARLIVDFSGDSLYMAGGTLLFNKETASTTDGVMDAVSALMRFVEITRSEGFICSSLDSLTPGYLMSVTVSGESTLTPVWHIITDTGELYVNAISGKSETVG